MRPKALTQSGPAAPLGLHSSLELRIPGADMTGSRERWTAGRRKRRKRLFGVPTMCQGAQSMANYVTPAERADHAAVYQGCAHTYPRGGRVPACQTRRTARSARKRCGGRRVLSRCCVPHLKFCATPVTSLTSKLTARAPQHRTAHRAPPSSRLAAASYRQNLSL